MDLASSSLWESYRYWLADLFKKILGLAGGRILSVHSLLYSISCYWY